MNDYDIARESSYHTPFSSSPLLPLLLMSLAQQEYSPKTTETFDDEYDYIIVGAGSAGSTVASRLSEEPCVNVLLLEAGGTPPMLSEVPALTLLDSDIDWSYKTVPQYYSARLHKNRQMNWHSGKTIGGTSVINAELFVRGNRRNYDEWAELGAEGWSYKDVLPYFKKLEDNNDVKLLQNSRIFSSFEVLSAVAFLNDDKHPKSKVPDVEIYFSEATVKGIKAEGLTDKAYDKAYKPYENRTIYRCDAQILHPKSTGYIQLQSSNPFDQPIINPNYYAVSDDLQDVVKGMKICYKFSNSSALQLLGSKPLNISLPGCEEFIIHSEDYLRCQAESVTTSTYNGVGTSKMGDPTDPTTVVDPKLRVKGIRGLRVVDASVMPTIPFGNTNIPTIMIAEKASDIIKRTIRCSLIQILK